MGNSRIRIEADKYATLIDAGWLKQILTNNSCYKQHLNSYYFYTILGCVI